MNAPHIHLILNHFPIFGILLGLILTLVFLVRKNETILIVALVTFIITGIITIPTFTSGEGAEEIVEHIPGIKKTMIEKHEELGEKSLVLVEAIALLSLIFLFLYKRKKARHLVLLIIALATGSSILLLYTNSTGGEIRHTEIQKKSNKNLLEKEHNED